MEDKNIQTTEPTAEELKAQLAAANNIIKQQSERIAEQDAQKASRHPVVTVDKVKYNIVLAGLTVDGKYYTATDIQKKADIANKLVKTGSGALVKVETEKA